MSQNPAPSAFQKPSTVCARFGFCQADPLRNEDPLDVLIPEAKRLLQLLQGNPLTLPSKLTQVKSHPFPGHWTREQPVVQGRSW